MGKNRPLKFIVQKGIAGFGDRLQYLLQAITYAKATNRILVVDWRDTHRTDTLRIHLQNLDIPARSIHLKPNPPDAGTEHLISIYFDKHFRSCNVFL